MAFSRVFRLVRQTVIITLILLAILPVLFGCAVIWGVTHMPCGAEQSPSLVGMTRYEAVTFPASELGQPVKGFFVQGTNGATIILPPTGGSGAGYWRPEYTLLNEHGYNLLNYESRRCLGQPISLGYSAVSEVGDALTYLETRADVDMTRVGIHGFSTAGATSIMAGARYPQLKAVIAEGGYYDFARYTEDQVRGEWFAPLYRLGAHVSYRGITGLDIHVLSPVSVIDQIAPRPVLLVYGTREPSLAGARLQLAAAGENAALWEVPNATHGHYYTHAPEEYTERITAFFDAALQ
jgi:uncharacterized protein